MGLFGNIKQALEQEQITDIDKMEFKRISGFASAAIQNFADKSLPFCPICKKDPLWEIHVANKTTSIFPIQEQRSIYHIKCQKCGAIMHVEYDRIGNSMPPFLLHPSPDDNQTMMIIDVVGSKAGNFDLAGKRYSILELNNLHDNKGE